MDTIELIFGILEIIVALGIVIIGSTVLHIKKAKYISFSGYLLTLISAFLVLVMLSHSSELLLFGGGIPLFLSCLSSIPALKMYNFPVKKVFWATFISSIITYQVLCYFLQKTKDPLVLIGLLIVTVWCLPVSFALGALANAWMLKVKISNSYLLFGSALLCALTVNAIFWSLLS